MSKYFSHTEALKYVQEGKRVLLHHKNIVVWFNPFCRDINILELRDMLNDENAQPKDIFHGKYSLACVHEIKIHPDYFKEVRKGNKSFEIRKNDRNYQVHDVVILKEFDPIKKEFTKEYNPFLKKVVNKERKRIISYITDFQQKEGYVVMGLKVKFTFYDIG